MTATDCFTCAQDARPGGPAPRDAIAFDDQWRVALCLGAAIEGWLVLLPRRHVETVSELTDAEAAGLGGWQVRLSRALHELTGCAKTYVAQFAETPGFTHVHFHVIPRAIELEEHLRGPGVFGLLSPPDRTHFSEQRLDAFAEKLRRHLSPRPPSGVAHLTP